MRHVLFWIAVSSVLFGVAVRAVTDFSWPLPAFLIFLGALVFVMGGMHLKSAGALVGVALVFLAGGMARMDVADVRGDPALDAFLGEYITLEGEIADEPDMREQMVRLSVLPSAIVVEDERTEIETSARVLVSVRLPAAFTYGQPVTARGVLEKPSAFAGDGGRTFDYPGFLAKDGIYYELPFAEVAHSTSTPAGSISGIKGALFWVKQTYLDGLAQALPEPQSALAGGITVGDKRALGGALLEMFRVTGIVHIVVLSGYNITIVAESIRRLFARAPRMLGIWGSAISIVFFVIATGASATGVRAGAMAALALLAQITGRRYAITRALALTAVGMVLWSPHILLFDPGFQLSVLATVGLIHVAPRIAEYLTWIPATFGLREIVAATLGTQLFVLPLLLYQIGLLSIVSVPVNVLILPLIPLSMLFSFIAGLAGALLGTFAVVFAAPAYIALSYMLWITEQFAALPFAAVSIEAFSVWWVFAAYAVLTAWLLRSDPPPQTNSNS